MVVPNTKLLNNHQTELARHLASEGYAIQSTTRCVPLSSFPCIFAYSIHPEIPYFRQAGANNHPRLDHLREAIDKAELLHEENKSRWPPNDPNRQKKTGAASAAAAPVSFWDIRPGELQKEEVAQMTHD